MAEDGSTFYCASNTNHKKSKIPLNRAKMRMTTTSKNGQNTSKISRVTNEDINSVYERNSGVMMPESVPYVKEQKSDRHEFSESNSGTSEKNTRKKLRSLKLTNSYEEWFICCEHQLTSYIAFTL